MGICPLYIVCILCAYYCTVQTVHISVQFILYTAHCTLYSVPCWEPVGGVHNGALHIVQYTLHLQLYLHHMPLQLEVCTLHCTLYIVLMPCTLHSSHCTCRITCWYTVPVHLCTSAPVHCTCACTPGTCTSLWYLQHIVLQVSAQHVYSIGDCST